MRLPAPAVMLVLIRDAYVLAGFWVLSRRGSDVPVILLGKISTALLLVASTLALFGWSWSRSCLLVGGRASLVSGSGLYAAWPCASFAGRGRSLKAAGNRRDGRNVKAVVMAGGQGTRLRPLTSNQPKPMVPIANKPTAQHILDLLARHGINDVVMTVAFLPQIIRNHFGDGSSLGHAHRVQRGRDAAGHRRLGQECRERSRRHLHRHQW